MPPKKNVQKTIKDERVKPQTTKDDYKSSEVDKEYFTNQFDAKEKIIARLKDDKIILENNIDDLKKKTNDLNIRFKDEYESAKKTLKEKNDMEEKRKAEIEDLKQQNDSMVESAINKLKEMDDEFIKEANKIKSTTAIYVGRLNKLDEYLKQEEKLKEKCENIKERIRVMNETYELQLKNSEENYQQFKNVTEKRMLRLYTDVIIHLKKQSISETGLVDVSVSDSEISDFMDMVKLTKKQTAKDEQIFTDIIEKNKRNINLEKSNRKKIDDHLDVYRNKKNAIKILRRELNKTQADIKNLSKKEYDSYNDSRSCHELVRGTDSIPREPKQLNCTVNSAKPHRTQAIRVVTVDLVLDNCIRTVEGVLLKVYDKALNHVDEMKINNKNCKEKTIECIQKFYEALEPFRSLRDLATIAPQQEDLEIQKNY